MAYYSNYDTKHISYDICVDINSRIYLYNYKNIMTDKHEANPYVIMMLVNGIANNKFANPKLIAKRIEDMLFGRIEIPLDE